MAYAIGQDLAVCFVLDQAIALDLNQGRYKGLGPRRASALRTALQSGEPDALDCILGEAGLVATGQSLVAEFLEWTPPRRSAHEDPRSSRGSLWVALEVAWDVVRIRKALKREPIRRIISRRRAQRRDMPAAQGASQDRAERLAQQFLAVRKLTPIEPVCLLDSLALAAFLARRGVDADLVFGVDVNPFEAHAWIQCGDCVLNETVHRAAMLTPILVV